MSVDNFCSVSRGSSIDLIGKFGDHNQVNNHDDFIIGEADNKNKVDIGIIYNTNYNNNNIYNINK